MRFGKLINTEYQRMVAPINREIEQLNFQLSSFHLSDIVNIPLSEDLEKLNIKIDLYDLKQYFTENKKGNK